MVQIINDGPLAHEEAWKAWQAGESCIVQPVHIPTPSAFLSRFKGEPGLFHYSPNAVGGIDLVHVPWTDLETRFRHGKSLKPFLGVVWTLMDNSFGYGLLLGKLFPLFHGSKVVPYRGTTVRMMDTVNNEQVTCIICVAEALASLRFAEEIPFQPGHLKAIINVCRPLRPEDQAKLKTIFGVRVYNQYALRATGTIAFSDGRVLEEHEVGDLLVPGETRNGELFIQPPCLIPGCTVDRDGWFATGKRAEIKDGARLFIYGDIG